MRRRELHEKLKVALRDEKQVRALVEQENARANEARERMKRAAQDYGRARTGASYYLSVYRRIVDRKEGLQHQLRELRGF